MKNKLNYLLFFLCFYLLKLSLFTGFEFFYLYVLCMILRDSMGMPILMLKPFLKILIWMIPFYIFPLGLWLSLPAYLNFLFLLVFVFAFYSYGFTGFYILQGYSFKESIIKAQVYKCLSLNFLTFVFLLVLYVLYSIFPDYVTNIIISLLASNWFFSAMSDLNLLNLDTRNQ